MCGIAGVVGIMAEQRRFLDRMLARIRHRGPDGAGVFQGAAVGLVHSRLSIIDLSDAASQPMQDPENGNVITFNGEIYNYAEVARELGPWPAGMSRGDTATLLRAYGRWGEEALPRLRGMFAFTIWDATKRKLFLARDRFGMKPLYYRRIGNSLFFASEIRPLLMEEYPHSANDRMLAAFLAFRHLDTTAETCFREVQQIPAAHYAWASIDGTISQPRPYWAPPPFGRRVFDESQSGAVRSAFVDSMVAHMRSDVPVGVFVSGGIDSSSIACTAAKLSEPGTLSSFSSVLTQAESNSENRLIPTVLGNIQSQAHNLEIDGGRFLDDLPKVFDCHEEPLADASMYAHWRLCELAGAAGIKVLLSGNGGDEVFGGYGSHLHACIGSLMMKARLLAAARSTTIFRDAGFGSFVGLGKRGVHEALPISVKTAIKRRHAKQWLADSVFENLAPGLRFYYETKGDVLENAFLDHLAHWSVPPFLHYEDRNGMAFGVEIRTPMLDHELLDVVWGYDPVTLLQGNSKHALREAMRGIVPSEVLEQPGKFGFAAPLDFFLRVDRKGFTELFQHVVAACPYFDAAAANRLLDGFYARRTVVVRPWRVFSVALWYDRLIRRMPATAG